MRIRTFTLVAVIALVVAACNQGETVADSTTPSTATPETNAAPEAMLLSYSLEPGASFTYEVDIDQQIDMTAEGDTAALGEEDVPGDMSLSVNGTTTFTHSVAEGPEPGTFAVTITGDLSGLEFTGTMDGAPVTDEDIPDFAAMEPVDVTIVVDEQGNIIPEANPGLGEDFLGGLGGMDMLDQLGPGAGNEAGQFVGPPFSEEEVTVGDTWSETVEVPTLPGEEPVSTQVDSRVLSTDTIEGNEVFVIETTTATSAIEFDLGQILIGFLTAFVPEDATDEDLAEIEELSDQLRFAFSVDPQTAELTTWFDYEAGLARQAEFSGATHMTMDINVPDETTGELVEMMMDMSIDQTINFRLTESDTA
ncbi:MAG TPA: hypothetical protein VI141_09955 [Acidimicrobiia bacterium]